MGAAHVAAQRAGAATVPGTACAVTFAGRSTVVIPAGQCMFSDSVPLRTEDGADLAVSLGLPDATGPASWHPATLTTGYRTEGAGHGADADGKAFARADQSWYFLDGVDVINPAVRGAVVAFGPSTNDCIGSAPDANERYPDKLARRLLTLPDGERMTVLNAGIAGNRLLSDNGTCGPSALNRFVRDAVQQSGVRAVILCEGTNDVATRPGLDLGTVAYTRMIEAAHASGLTIIGATLQPHEGAGFYSPAGNRLREAVNEWIRWSGSFDDVADFDRILLDPRYPRRLLPAYDSGDHLHPGNAGYDAIADSVDLAALAALADNDRLREQVA